MGHLRAVRYARSCRSFMRRVKRPVMCVSHLSGDMRLVALSALHYAYATMTPSKRKSTICAQLEAAFGVPLGPALFYQFNYGLRFELGGEVFGNDNPIPRFLQAIERARTVARALFDESRKLDAVLCFYPAMANPRLALFEWKKRFQEIGFPFRLGKAERVMVVEDDAEPGDAYCQFWFRVTLAPERDPAMDVLLWAAVAQEMPVTPTINPGSFSQTDIYLVDFAART